MLSEAPVGWSSHKAAEVFALEYGKPLPAHSRSGDGYPVFGSNGAVGYHETPLVKGPGIVVGRKGTAGAVLWTDQSFYPIDTTYFVEPKTEVDLRWLYYALLGSDLPGLSESTGVPGLNRNMVYKRPFPLPPLPEQKKIAAILASVDEAIQATEAVIEQTRRVKDGLLQDLLTRGVGHTRFKQTEIGEIPESWDVVPLKQVIRKGRPICYGILKPGRTVEGGVPVIKVKNIKGGVIIDDDLLLTDPEIDAAYQRSKLLSGDVLISIRGTTGRVAIVPPSLEDANITQDTARLSIAESVTTNMFVYYTLQSRQLQRYITLHTIGQAVKGINIAEVRKIPIALPPQSEQDRIVEMVSAVQDHIWQEGEKLQQLRHAKDGLLQDLLTGAVRVSP